MNLVMHEQEGTIQLFVAVKCPKMDIVLQQIAESYLLAHAPLSKLTRPLVMLAKRQITNSFRRWAFDALV